ncbi:uncharacterized protein K452DRAFT_299063 [Aplosporella prunicola CBS 121167]|uniref:Patatin-like phospholipase domain-containing protein n=1 Tax=Aplosporella prunicola CBS 121167 TaxID=1176127 RepID=A0A6A6B9W9_9PEZI|nr:uncharacterized protein K452DRAFT_299063 [Aplosporella prunicola CBS 121167]KAF2140999.1 hypothetical protein K452DRAFT_299063 [Aplosporella prunicola CBS 121167]
MLMSFLQDALLPGATTIHAKNGPASPSRLRAAPRRGGLLSPLVRIVKERAGVFETFLGPSRHEDPAASTQWEDGSRRQILYLRMQDAKNYDAWRAAALELDQLEGNNDWKHQKESCEYDYELVESRLKQLDEARIECDVHRMLFLIRTALTRGLGGMGHLELYKHSHIGTKALIERYIDSAKETLCALLNITAKQGENGLDPRYVLEQLLATRQSFGRSALLLSGGGTFGMNHIGVIKSLWEQKLLPRIISGASAGSIVCAVLCTRTDEEMPQILEEFCYGDLEVFEKEGDRGVLKKLGRFLKYGAVFDISHLSRVMRNLLGNMTFQEAYNRTRRILNITVSSASMFELPRLLNYITAPNVIIWSAVAASCSVPLVFSAASLQAKDPKTGEQVPWDPTPGRWIDGSVDNDLPMTRLAEMFNVNHFIVSQVNPHVVPFLMKEEGAIAHEAQQDSAVAAGPSWLHNMANLAKGEALHRLHVLADLGIFPNYCTKARSILSQRYAGDITIFPAISYAQFPRILTNPTPDFMEQAMICGEKATWTRVSRIQNHCAIELALDDAVRQLRASVVFSPSQVDLRSNVLGRPRSSHSESGRGRGRTVSRDRHHQMLSEEFERKFPGRPITLRLQNPIIDNAGKATFRSPRNSDSVIPQAPAPAPDIISSSAEEEPITSDSEQDGASVSSMDSPPSPLPHVWQPADLFASVSQPSTPNLGNRSSLRSPSSPFLAMTQTPTAATQPSSPERIYKRLFHPPVKTQSQLEDSPDIPDDKQKNMPNEGRRRGSGSGLQIDISGTRGMLMRRKKSTYSSLRDSTLPGPGINRAVSEDFRFHTKGDFA